MMQIRKESWKDITRRAQEAVYSDMEMTLHLNFRKLCCLREGLLALEPGMFAATDEMKNARAVLLKEIGKAIGDIQAEANRFKEILDCEVKKKLVEARVDRWNTNQSKRFTIDDDDEAVPVFNLEEDVAVLKKDGY